MSHEHKSSKHSVRRYYLMGVVGVGKSTLRENLRSLIVPEQEETGNVSIYTEFPKSRAAEVNHAKDTLSQCSAEEIQKWIFMQLADKNRLIAEDKSALLLIDRTPLDTFAFYPPQEWQARAQQMLEALDSTLAAGELIFLEGSPAEIHKRMDNSRGYSINTLAQQQSSFEILLDWLIEQYNYRAKRINVRGLAPCQVAEKALAIIKGEDYTALDIQKVVEALAGGQE